MISLKTFNLSCWSLDVFKRERFCIFNCFFLIWLCINIQNSWSYVILKMGLDILNLFQLNIGVFCGLVLSINIIIKVWAQDGKRQRCSRTSSPVRTVSHPWSKVHWSSQRQTVTGAVRIFINASVESKSKKYGHSYFKMLWIIYSCKNSWKVISCKTLKTKCVTKEIYDGWRFWSRLVNMIVTTWGCIYSLACLVSGCELQLISEWEQGV